MFLVVVFGNSWIWKIFKSDFWLGMGLLMAGVVLYALVSNSPLRKILPLVLLMGVLMWQQWVTTNRAGLTEMSAEEMFLRQERVGYYPEFFKRGGVWWELRPEMVAVRMVGGNFFQAIDLNYYFFAGHPRESIGVPIISKFSFIYYFIFLLGVVQLIKVRRKIVGFWIFVVLGFGLPIGLLSVTGHENLLGPVVMFPGMVVVIYLGIKRLLGYLLTPSDSPLVRGRMR